MPDANGAFKGISLGGKAAEAWERIFGLASAVEHEATPSNWRCAWERKNGPDQKRCEQGPCPSCAKRWAS